MAKPKLIYNLNEAGTFNNGYAADLYEHCFDVLPYDSSKNYNKHNTAFVTKVLPHETLESKNWLQSWINDGYRVVVDDFWDTRFDEQIYSNNTVLYLRNKNFFWYNECMWYHQLGYQNYKPQPINDRTFLMMINLQKNFRDIIFNSVEHLLDNALYSYLGRGIHIEHDTELDFDKNPSWQRHMNPTWYDRTCFSLVVETFADNGPTFVSEKTYKALAFHHPLLVFGNHGILSHIRSLGFETYPELFDESYDKLKIREHRLPIILGTLEHAVRGNINWQDSVLLQKQKHNSKLFFDKPLVIQRWHDEINTVILDWIENEKTR